MKKLCPYFGSCGGCLFQDLPFDEYLKSKRQKIVTALARKAIHFPIDPVISVPVETRRRATFAYQNNKFGFFRKKSHDLIDIHHCLLLVPTLQNLMPSLKTLCQQIGEQASICVLMTNEGADIALSTKSKGKTSLHTLETIASFCQQQPVLRFVLNNDIIYQIAKLPYPSNVFLQPSQMGESLLVENVLQHAKGAHKGLDLFCGTGTFTLPMNKVGIITKGVDLTVDSILFLKQQGVNAIIQDLFRHPILAEELNLYDVVVLDPARAGANAQCQQIAESSVAKVIMVSCNPATFARDAHTLTNGGYQLKQLTPIDQFIYSEHIEIVSLFER